MEIGLHNSTGILNMRKELTYSSKLFYQLDFIKFMRDSFTFIGRLRIMLLEEWEYTSTHFWAPISLRTVFRFSHLIHLWSKPSFTYSKLDAHRLIWFSNYCRNACITGIHRHKPIIHVTLSYQGFDGSSWSAKRLIRRDWARQFQYCPLTTRRYASALMPRLSAHWPITWLL